MAMLCAVIVTGAVVVGVVSASAEGSRVSTGLTGEAEVPGPGDPDGRGRAVVSLNGRAVCFDLSFLKIGPPMAAHIHEGPPDVAGPIVVTFFMDEAGLPAELRGVRGCVRHVDRDLVADIKANPNDYYVNVHNAAFPAGAIRGQLRDN
ncbi:MAG: CHRD domain-containing protein [Actinobacteria bacterium]|nr:CHRD domain-containing protein [Actinomycetota bacterium]